MFTRRDGAGPARRGGFRDLGGGGAAPASPLQIPNLVHRYKGTYAAGVWTDEIAGLNTTQGTGTAQPTFQATDADFNGRSSLSFDGGDRLDCGAVTDWKPWHDGTGSTILIIWRVSATGTNVLLDTCNVTAANVGFALRANGTTLRLGFHVANGTALIVNDTSTVIALNTTYVTVVRFLEGGGTDWTLRLNGAASASGSTSAAPSSANSTADLAIGARSTSNDQQLTGEIAELCMWNRSISDTEVTGTLSAYTNAEYARAA